MKFISDEDYKVLREWTKNYIDKQCIHRVPLGQPKLPGKVPGSKYTWMFYLRRGLFDHKFSSAISQMFIYKMEKEVGHFDFQLSGLETASTPMLTSIPTIGRIFGIDLNAFSIRKEQKEYGLMNWIEGVPNTKPVMLIDDLCNSSASMKKAYDIVNRSHVNKEPLKVFEKAFTIVNKSNQQVHSEQRQNSDLYLPKEIKVISLFNLDDFNLSNPSH
jgi:orotate phosphoribosyltransferase